jgi:hypothetical protein
VITDAYNLAEVFGAGLIGAFFGAVGVFIATVSVRNDAAADRAEAKQDLADAVAARVAMDSARQLGTLHPAYAAQTAEYRMIEARAAEPERCHGCGHDIAQHSGPGVQPGRERCWVVDCECRLSGAQARATARQPDEPAEQTASASDLDDMLMPDFVPGQPLPEHQGGPASCCDGHDAEQCIVARRAARAARAGTTPRSRTRSRR